MTTPPDQPDIHKRRLCDDAVLHNIPLLDEEQIYDHMSRGKSIASINLEEIDVVLSMFHQSRIKSPILDLPKIGAINIHPAPLPEFQGWGVYNFAIVESCPFWGVTAHYMDEGFDTGPIIVDERFDVDMQYETAFSLERRTQPVILRVVRKLLHMLETGKPDATPQRNGRYISKKDFLRLRTIEPTDTPEMVDRKIRAFWYPPHPGAQLAHTTDSYTIVNTRLLHQLSNLMLADSTELNDFGSLK
ncbi:MAG: formyltransferase family protein [Phycisphaerales bacterium]